MKSPSETSWNTVVSDPERDAIRQWIAVRIQNIHRRVTAHEVLQRNGVVLRYGSGDREEQISCPFHGKDTSPSARVYPESAKGPSGVWCFVCQEQWDCIRLWKKFNHHEGKFTALLREIEHTYAIEVPESPRDVRAEDIEDTSEVDALFDMIAVCERRLKKSQKAFDYESYVRVIIALDRIRYQVNERKMPMTQARVILTTILEKIAVRVRACPED